MKMRISIIICATLFYCSFVTAQNENTVKTYTRNVTAGEVTLLKQWTENNANRSSTVFTIEVPVAGLYGIAIVSNLQKGAVLSILADNTSSPIRITASENGWQKTEIATLQKNTVNKLYLAAGRHLIAFSMFGNVPPLIDQISFNRNNRYTELENSWKLFSTKLNALQSDQPVSNAALADKSPETGSAKILSNPESNYDHAIDTAFSYSTFQFIYLTAGNMYTFSTSGSTKDPVLHLFDPANIEARSWSADDYNGTWESNLVVNITVSGTYCLLARPYSSSQTGTTNIFQNGVILLANTPIGGQRFTTTPRTGNLNYFTARLSNGTNPDTRIFTLVSSGGKVTGYNDDYANNNGGTWAWGLASRINKNYAQGNSYVFVCAYSSVRTGNCDVYMGNTNATLPTSGEATNFPLLKGEDALQAAPNSGSYNCIAWSGGMTTSWVWPPDALSTWNVPGNNLAGFDKYYANTPLRYPGAWNYTRSGATSLNSVVDLWKTAMAYTHASVTKPGNNNPHGYDWESKPGSFDRTLHPRNALNNANWYGFVSNYYKFSGTYARNAGLQDKYQSDLDAITAGVAVLDQAVLGKAAMEKLKSLVSKTDISFVNGFNELYVAWDKIKINDASFSDPSMYCNNPEFEMLNAFCKKNTYQAMLLVMDKFVNNKDHFIGKLLLNLTIKQYGNLLTEVKAERENNPNDEQGRYKIHGDHDNGVLYIEKILNKLQLQDGLLSEAPVITVSLFPNPAKDLFAVQVLLKSAQRVAINAFYSQNGISKILLSETELPAGNHSYTANVRTFKAVAGSVITVQVIVNDIRYLAKLIVL
jgi:hypothetical protein